MALAQVSLEDKYELTHGRVFLTGIQALVRLPLIQRQLDRRAGLRTAGFISGYRGSPLAGLDQQLWAAREHLARHDIHFQPGVNEELGATAVWGSQQVQAYRGARTDGVFGLWYGKAPGVDRSGDAIKHANAAGTARHGGVLLVCGDDHACKSSTLPSQSELALMDACVPALNPAGVQEVLDYGRHAWALSRFSGLWVGMIALADTMDSAAVVEADAERVRILLPELGLPPGGLWFRPGRAPLEQEALLHEHRLPAALAYIRANELNRTVVANPSARLGIVTTGKAHLDALQALQDLGLDGDGAAAAGICVFKVGAPWPLEPESLRAFARGLERILVVEEKRAFVESQAKEILYGLPDAPRIVGKRDEAGHPLLPSTGDLSPAMVARAIAAQLPEAARSGAVAKRLEELDAREAALSGRSAEHVRLPYYCSGCPHNRSTVVPEGSRGLAGIGCHYMVQWMDRRTDSVTQMGGEGASWIGQAPFTDEPHVFVNLGDGTYFHSGILAVRAAVAAGVNVTYKILYNDAVAMTGGQGMDGPLTVPQLTRQLAAEGVAAIAVVSDNPGRYPAGDRFARDTRVHPREELDAVQRRLRELPGTTVLVYDQTCAAELRRRRKRGLAPDPDLRLFIHEDVCEGCGDCSVQSNCAAVEPVETEFGRKRRINQSSCNKDYSCAEGLCPSFVSVRGGRLRRDATPLDEGTPLPQPVLPELGEPWSILVTGVGGTGVVTIGALLGMAAHLEGRAATTLDMTGLAQKGGAVTSHIRIAAEPDAIHTPRIPAARADALLACDLVVASQPGELMRLAPTRTRSVLNTHVLPTAEFILDNEVEVSPDELAKRVHEQSLASFPVDASALARRFVGDAIYTNALVLGYAWQRGLLPLSRESLARAIELNGVAVEQNLRAFELGRRAAHEPERFAEPAAGPAESLDEKIARRAQLLSDYAGPAYAERYRAFVARVRASERELGPGDLALTEAVALSYAKLLAYKDEYEVARLYTRPEFRERLEAEFDGDYRVELNLAPPLWARRDPETGRPKKRRYRRWIWPALGVLARLRFLRGTPFDPFGYTAERRLERALITDYERTLGKLLAHLTPHNRALAVEIARLPLEIRGFDLIKRANAERVKERERTLLERFEKSESETHVLPLLAAREGRDGSAS